MIFSYFYYELGKTLNRRDICGIGYGLAREILDDFYIPEKGLIIEFIDINGNEMKDPLGQVCVPGHVNEGHSKKYVFSEYRN